MNWKRMLAYVTGFVDEELLAQNEYLVTENRILRNQVQGRIRDAPAGRNLLRQSSRWTDGDGLRLYAAWPKHGLKTSGRRPAWRGRPPTVHGIGNQVTSAADGGGGHFAGHYGCRLIGVEERVVGRGQ